MRVPVVRDILSANDQIARQIRDTFATTKTFVVNLMSSPGAGKTSLLEATIDALGDELAIAVVEGDLETENDARRIRAKGVQAIQIATGTACHLDAHMVHDALHALPLAGIDLLFIENVGNLVCPASFDLGQHSQRHPALGPRGRRQAGQVSGHLPGGRCGAADQGRRGAGLRLRSGLLPPRRADGQSRRTAVRRLVQVGRGHG